MNDKLIGLKTIAYELGYSVNTVSRALRDCDDISEETKEKVRKKAYELGYMPNNISQFIKKGNKKLIAIVFDSFRNPYFQIVSSKLVTLIHENGYEFTAICANSKKLTLEVLKQCISERVDAIITLLEPEKDIENHSKLHAIPIVVIGRKVNLDFIDEVYTDDELGGTLVANYLTNFHSINKFIYVKVSNVECSKRREKSFLNELKNNSKDNEILVIDSKQINGSFLNYIIKGYQGVFCMNDEIAYEILYQLNKVVPNIRKVYPHFHIIGYDGISTELKGYIDLTSVTYDYDAICFDAVSFVLERLKNKDSEKKSKMYSVLLHTRKLF